MTSPVATPSSASALHPFPTGWYALAFSTELKKGQMQGRTYFGQEMVLFRGERGEAVAMDAYCPHMGAHMGHGGEVVGDALRCPFHHFCFDAQGSCVSAPYGKKTPRAKAQVWPVVERNGLILCWHDQAKRAPLWEIPKLDDLGFGQWETHCWPRLRSHPQETTENSVDMGHFSVVHGYSGVEVLSPLKLEGPYLTTRYAMKRANPFLPFGKRVRTEFELHVLGLGYSFVEVDVKDMALQSRHFVLPVPIDGEHIELRIAASVRLQDPSAMSRLMKWVPNRLATELISRLVFKTYAHDVSQDFTIWENKRYMQPPALAEGDGPVGPYRQWCRQFYPALPVVA